MLKLPQKTNALTEVDLTLTPYLINPMEYIGNTKVKMLGAIAPTQSGKTLLLQTAVADSIHQDPGPLLYLLPDENMGKKMIKEKIIDVIEATPELSSHKTRKVRDISKSGIELDHMNIGLGWGGSLGSMSSIPRKRACIDECRLLPLTVGNESNAVQLVEDRLTTYLKWGLGQYYIVSSPSVEGDLLHSQLDISGTSVWFWCVPCLKCGTYQRLTLKNNIREGRCFCTACSAEFSEENDKRSWNTKGKYVRMEQNEDGKWVVKDPNDPENWLENLPTPTERMIFWWNSEVSPFRTFKRIYNKYLETKDKLHDFKNFVQCWEANFFVEDISNTSVMKLKERRSNYACGDVPPGVKVILTGIDTQDNGFYISVRGFGAKGYTPLIDAYYMRCDMHTASREDVYDVFESIFNRVYIGEKDVWKTALCGIDTGGHRTKEIYSVASDFSKVILVKGRNNQDLRYSYNPKLNLYLVRTHEYLDETEQRSVSKGFLLPDNISNDFLVQYCAVRKIKDKPNKNGEKKVIWKKRGQCDYRFADIHTFLLLDIQTERGILRHEIEKDGFILNPAGIHTKNKHVERVNRYNPASQTSDRRGGFIGDLNEEWL